MKLKLACFSLTILAGLVFSQQLPFPGLGKQHPYMTTVSILHTSVVTTVSEVKFLRVIETRMDGTNLLAETNYIALRTNVVAVMTNWPASQP